MKKTISALSRLMWAAAVGALALSFSFAQQTMQPQSVKGAVIKGKAPVSKEVLKVNLPKPTETKLGNGMQVIVLENHKLPTFNMQMVILSGGLSDPVGKQLVDALRKYGSVEVYDTEGKPKPATQ